MLGHGLGSNQAVWSSLRPSLDARFRVLSYELAGVGPHLPADFDPRRYAHLSGFADDLLALLDETGVERCRYVGHSASGMIGALAAIEDPALFDRLVMINASPRYLDADGYTGGFSAADLHALLEAMRRNYEGWIGDFAPAVVGTASPTAIDTFSAGLLAMRPDVTAAVARAIFESDLRALLPEVRVPVVLIHSRQDIAVPPGVSQYLLEHLPDARRVWIDASGHLPHLSHPSAVLAALEQAL